MLKYRSCLILLHILSLRTLQSNLRPRAVQPAKKASTKLWRSEGLSYSRQIQVLSALGHIHGAARSLSIKDPLQHFSGPWKFSELSSELVSAFEFNEKNSFRLFSETRLKNLFQPPGISCLEKTPYPVLGTVWQTKNRDFCFCKNTCHIAYHIKKTWFGPVNSRIMTTLKPQIMRGPGVCGRRNKTTN